MSEYINAMRDIMELAIDIIGNTQSVRINTGIYQHQIDDLPDELELGDDIYSIRGSEDSPITLELINKFIDHLRFQFKELEDHNLDDRTYFYEGLEFNIDKNLYEISWGS